MSLLKIPFVVYLHISMTFLCFLMLLDVNINHFYRAMYFSAKRGIAIACRLSVCQSVCL